MRDLLFVSLWEEQKKLAYARYVAYKAMRAKYELALQEENTNNWTWNTCCSAFLFDAHLRKVAQSVIDHTIFDYAQSGFHFQAKREEIHLFLDDEPGIKDGMLQGVCLYQTEKEEKSSIELLSILLETSYYNYQLQSGKKYIWEDYLKEVQTSPEMLYRLRLAFCDALMEMDFKDGWINVIL